MKNSRNTIQRSLVLTALSQLNHPNADEIYSEILKNRPTVSRGTVYRNLNLLSDAGAILRLTVAGGADRFDPNIHNHCHILCEKCLKVFDINATFPHGLLNNIKDSGFLVNGYSILYNGICPDCLSQS